MQREELDFSKGLLPAICQDVYTLEVRMLGFMNEEALRKTQETGRVTFWSRSRQTLWVKGATSGNSMEVVEIRVNCDKNSLLILIRPAGPTCHTGATSCYIQEDGEPRLLDAD